MASPKLSADRTGASLVSLATFLPAGRQRHGGQQRPAGRQAGPLPPRARARQVEEIFFCR